MYRQNTRNTRRPIDEHARIEVLINDLAAKGIQLFVEDGELRARHPDGLLTDHDAQQIACSKVGLVAFLCNQPLRKVNTERLSPPSSDKLDAWNTRKTPTDVVYEARNAPQYECANWAEPSEEMKAHLANSEDWWSRISDEDYQRLTSPPERPPKCFFCGGICRHGKVCQELHDSWAIEMPFGKHKGKKIADVATDYLRWLLSKSLELNSDVRDEIERVLDSTGFRINAWNAH